MTSRKALLSGNWEGKCEGVGLREGRRQRDQSGSDTLWTKAGPWDRRSPLGCFPFQTKVNLTWEQMLLSAQVPEETKNWRR